jgi:hypothetical protein
MLRYAVDANAPYQAMCVRESIRALPCEFVVFDMRDARDWQSTFDNGGEPWA